MLLSVAVTGVWGVAAASKPYFAFNDGTEKGVAEFWGGVVGTITGYALFVWIVVWVVLFFAWVRTHNPRAAASHLLILGGVALLSTAVATLFVGIPRGVDAIIATRKPVEARLLETLTNDFQTCGRGIHSDLGRANAGDAPRPAIAAARMTLARCREVTAHRYVETRAAYARLAYPDEDMRQALLSSFDAMATQATADRTRLWDRVEAVIGEVEALVALRESGACRLGPRGVKCANPAAAAAYNQHVERFQQLESAPPPHT